MHLDALLVPRHLQERQSSCVTCPATPPCNCTADQDCFQIAKSCTACGSFTCVAKTTSGSNNKSSGGVSKGAVAGAVIAVLILLGIAVAMYFWYRRRLGRQTILPAEVKDVPAPAEAVLNRPDPSEKLTSRPPTELINSTVRVYSHHSEGTINLDPESELPYASPHPQSPHYSQQSNPFSDGQSSIQTAGSDGTQGTNVIPIALISPGAPSTLLSSSNAESDIHPLAPMRPARSPDLNLMSDPLNAAGEGLRAPYAQSQISGISGVSSRNSYISNMSYSSEFLNEAPVIVTANQGVRQVIGSVRAEMVSASGSSGSNTPTTANSLAPPSPMSGTRPSIRSPLAATSFGPSDVLSEHDEEQELSVRDSNPFGDEHSPDPRRTGSPRSVTTFGVPSPAHTGTPASGSAHSSLLEPAQPWQQPNQGSRPSSISTQAGSIIEHIGSATRVNVGLRGLQSGSTMPDTPSSAGQNLRSPYRTTMGRLVSPKSGVTEGSLEEQQQRALAHAQARAQAQGGERGARRVSGASAISNTADSILESFPFVPPSPISDRPVRSPPRSPNQATFSQVKQAPKSSGPPPRPPPPPEPLHTLPLNKGTFGRMSSGSQLSTASSGLGSFPFQIDQGPSNTRQAPPSSFEGRQRASLDTLALTSDLSSYPLGYDRREQRDSFPPSFRNP